MEAELFGLGDLDLLKFSQAAKLISTHALEFLGLAASIDKFLTLVLVRLLLILVLCLAEPSRICLH